jgi:hypothetical protein
MGNIDLCCFPVVKTIVVFMNDYHQHVVTLVLITWAALGYLIIVGQFSKNTVRSEYIVQHIITPSF